jgi:AcrR family transcriptional regulator
MKIVRRTREEQREDTRRRLLDAARRVFLQRGFHGASLDLVAEEAGFTKGAVYSRFASKADLFLTLLDERIATRIAEMEAAAAHTGDPGDLGAAIGRQWDTKLGQDERWSLALIEFRVHAARDAVLNERYAAAHARLLHAIAAIIEREWREAGRTPPMPAMDIARAAVAMGTGAVLERAADAAGFPKHLTETMQRALVRGLHAEASEDAAAATPRRARRR